jgi:hypothetical protein
MARVVCDLLIQGHISRNCFMLEILDCTGTDKKLYLGLHQQAENAMLCAD